MADEFTSQLSDYLDDEDLPAAERVRIERHLEACAECRATLTELRQVAEHGRTLPDFPPQRDLWPEVAARIGVAQPAGRPRWAQAFSRTVSFTLPQLAAAALALMVLSGGLVWLARVGSPGTDFEPLSAQAERTAAPADTARAVAGAKAREDAASDLQRTLGPWQGRVDPDTLGVLERNLTIANQAIEDCQRALADDPSNPEMNAQLAGAQRMKLMLLQRAGALAAAPRP